MIVMFVLYDWPVLHVCSVWKFIIFNFNLWLFCDCVVFYKDLNWSTGL